MKDALMKRLEVFLHREDNRSLLGIPASPEEIVKAQQQLNVSFHEDYIDFIKMFGEHMQVLQYMHFRMALASGTKQLLI